MYTILGGGLSGISASYHLGHDKCVVYERNNFLGGHVHTEFINGFTWDEGPHVSFTKNQYVKSLFANNVADEFLEYPVTTANYYKGIWIPHPAQSNLYAIPKALRDNCLRDFLLSRERIDRNTKPSNYAEWLKFAFGETFYKEFPRAYTKKYWTVEPELLTTDWVGERVFYPDIEEVKAGYLRPLDKQTHYITNVRYPKYGGYFSYTNKIRDGLRCEFNKTLSYISFERKYMLFDNQEKVKFTNLISTIPLPILVAKSDAPRFIKDEAQKLSCSSVLLVNVTANHPTLQKYNWMYIYDEGKYSTRINCTELLSPQNAPTGKTGVQVEVYFSAYSPLTESTDSIAKKVCNELVEMGIIRSLDEIIDYHTKVVEWANVIFDFNRKTALNNILNWLSEYGLSRNSQDLNPMTNWEEYQNSNKATIHLAGRFAEWKYYWTDDCVLKGNSLIAEI